MPKLQLERSSIINASPERVFQTIADYQTWTTWSPWLISDPNAKVTVTKDPSAVGSKYHWLGTVTGEGELVHKHLQPGQLIEDDLTFLKPFKSLAKTSFHLRPDRQGTHVTWTMDSQMPWFLFWLVPMMKTLIGMDYQRGLNMLKDLIETGTIPSQLELPGVETVQPFRMAGIAATSPVNAIGASQEKTFASARAAFEKLRIPLDGDMISVYTKFNMKEGVFHYISGYIIPDAVSIPADSALITWKLRGTSAFRVRHIGSYRHLGNGWSAANQIARYHKLKTCRTGTYEIYRTPAPETPESDLITDIYLPLR